MPAQLLVQAPAHELDTPTQDTGAHSHPNPSFTPMYGPVDALRILPTASDPTVKAGLGDISFGFTSTLPCSATFTVVHNPILGSCQTLTQAQPTPNEKDLADLLAHTHTPAAPQYTPLDLYVLCREVVVEERARTVCRLKERARADREKEFGNTIDLMPQLAGMNHQHQAHHEYGCERKAQNVVTQLFGGCVEAELEYKPKATPQLVDFEHLLQHIFGGEYKAEQPTSATQHQPSEKKEALFLQRRRSTPSTHRLTQAAPLNLDVLRRQIVLEERARIVRKQEELQAFRADEVRKAQAAQAHEVQCTQAIVAQPKHIDSCAHRRIRRSPWATCPSASFPVQQHHRLNAATGSGHTPPVLTSWLFRLCAQGARREQQANTVNLENILTQLFGRSASNNCFDTYSASLKPSLRTNLHLKRRLLSPLISSSPTSTGLRVPHRRNLPYTLGHGHRCQRLE
ncbi:hypothetical protein B0H14DRAFT_3561208 [Mycena olivaceomarginata]|nr:hypothetical protein B0H14DRAFT_3561208 [Mycena olivaceomarginata]